MSHDRADARGEPMGDAFRPVRDDAPDARRRRRLSAGLAVARGDGPGPTRPTCPMPHPHATELPR